MNNRTRLVGLIAGTALAVTAVAPAAAQPTEYPRNETLYTSGTQWGPPGTWNPIQDWGYAMGTLGLVYEPLFNYDPLTNEYIPWIAESGEWTADLEYTIKVRDGVTWADGEPVTAEDVKFTIDLGQRPGVPYSGLWDFIETVEVADDLTAVVTFSAPQHAEWSNFLYNRAVLPEHLWGERSDEEIMGANESPVGSGPYQYLTHDQGRMVWEKRDGWWGTEALGLDPKPTYIVDIVNGSNNVALGLVLQGGLDMSNNFLPGVATLVEGGYGISTFYPEPPYMMSSNTAWLATNNTKPPLDDPAFRKALASSIDTDTIVNVVYGNIVKKASPTGLLPPWEMYVDQAVVDELGFDYDPEAASAMLDEAGYVDADGDGWRDNLDGSPIALEIIVPNGWTDWMESIRVISDSAKAVGINVETAFPDYGARTEAIQNGTFDLAIVNDKQLSNTPWTYYQYIFRLPIEDVMSNENYGRYENEEAWALVQQLSQTPVDDTEAIMAITSQLQAIHLADLPLTPLWYNGMWSQVSDAVWTNWPSADGNQYLPTTWRGFWQMGGIRMLDALEPVVAE
ncbi:MAG TPA: ABC transporter substrate-binding protein [Anaerolineae bacterium]|nr:ABC transporter substrate-binding protein [Anaerolineae bacterium]